MFYSLLKPIGLNPIGHLTHAQHCPLLLPSSVSVLSAIRVVADTWTLHCLDILTLMHAKLGKGRHHLPIHFVGNLLLPQL